MPDRWPVGAAASEPGDKTASRRRRGGEKKATTTVAHRIGHVTQFTGSTQHSI